MNSLQIGEWLRSSLLTPNFHQTNNHDRTRQTQILLRPPSSAVVAILSTSLVRVFPW
ncbi:hypothetical protein MtrunA17_Chr4g0023901 [Medicago truncatula]|uniref:Uncharacterized protein n=1 Tax=Medicago truncatula TaxID=3880 RepID=A0A396I3T5_MEDTR|nr:hypothetical protein MtrunA17_Chr4g0023901 [Medicago truncatula]